MTAVQLPEGEAIADLRGDLQAFLADRLPRDAAPEVLDVRRVGTGSSRENWPFDAEWSENGVRSVHRLLMRRDPPASVVDTTRSAEFALLRSLAGTGLPVPAVHWLDDDGARLSRPTMIVERHNGQADRAVLRPADPLGLGPAGQRRLAERMCDVLCDLHAIDVVTTGIRDALPDPGPQPAARELEHWICELDAQELEPQPELRCAASWLREQLPPPPPALVLVHGDYRPANMLVHDGRLAVVLDWELAHLGDPLDDLGWYTAPLYRREHFIPQHWEQRDLLDRYTARTGREMDPDHLHFWQVFSTFRLAIIALSGVRAFVAGGSDRAAAPAQFVIGQVLAAMTNERV